MNLTRYEDVIFTDNLTQAFKNYEATGTFNCKGQADYLKGRLDQYINKVNELRNQYFTQNNVNKDSQQLLVTPQQAFQAYFSVHNTAKEFDLDGGGINLATRPYTLKDDSILEFLNKNKDNLQQVYLLLDTVAYTQISFFGDMHSEWDVRCSPSFLADVLTLTNEEFDVVLFYITMIARGIFFLHKFIGKDPKHLNWVLDPYLAYSVLFTESFNQTNGIVGAIMPERIPKAWDNKNSLKEFVYRQFVLLHKIKPMDQILQEKRNYAGHKSDLYYDEDKYKCLTYSNVNFRKDAPHGELQMAVQYKHLFTGDFISFQIKPLKIFKWMLNEPAIGNFQFDPVSRRWTQTAHTVEVAKQSYQPRKEEAEAKIMKQLDSASQTKKLVQILNMMPTLNIKLSPLQQNVISSNQNLLCLGRSGTGKTTTSVLRLFAQEILYIILKNHNQKQAKKLREQKKKEKEQNLMTEEQKTAENPDELTQEKKVEPPKKKEALLKGEDLEQNTGMKMVFITASPVLTNEVKRFYGSIKQKLINHLKKREAEREKRMADFQDISEKEANEIIDQAIAEQEQDEIETIEDHERKEMLEFIKKEEKDLMEDIQLETQMNMPNSFDELKPHHFPMFATVKKLIYMMDACLNYSFFSRDHNNNIIGLDSNLGWHNESKGVMMINHYYKESMDYDDQIAKFGKEILEMDKEVELGEFEEEEDTGLNFKIANEGKNASSKFIYHNRQADKYIIEKQQLSFEVDYDIFESKFWPKIGNRKNMKKLSPTLIWTEIYSVIKGGLKSCEYYMGYLPKHIYVKNEASDFLNINEKKTIYYIFLQYEKWKSEQRAYDFMDIVNHLQKRQWYGETLRRMKIDYLMVDEVQDLTPKTLQVLLRLTSHNVFFAGDTAQTIAKGVGARFLDLRHIFAALDYEVPKIVQLTKNYRSHGKILDLANSVVSLIELFFPKTIDKLVKEESETDGMKPIVVMPLDNRLMRTFFTGTHLTSDKDSTLAVPQFGCNQVIIVRDQAAKDYIPDIFQNMLCLTVYEAKGLEFDDVILYNFFHLGEVSKSQWKLLNDILFESVKRIKYQQDILDFDALDAEHFEEFMKKIKDQEKDENQEYEEDVQLSVNRHRDEVYRKFSLLCVELKFLYVAITRPKRRLIIYDDVIEGRKPIQNYWEKLNVVDIITKDMIKEPETLDPKVREIFEQGALVKDRSSVDEWRIQGIKLFKKKYYDSAIKCFQNSGDDDLVKRCMAYQEADLGSNKQSEADSKTWRAKVIKHLTKTEKRKLLKEAKKERLVAKKHFENAGHLFEAIQMLKHAGSCFFTGRVYPKAAQIFEALKQYGQAAECLMFIDELKRAAQLYEKAGLISKAIECFEACGEWEQLLHCLHRNKEFFKVEERQSLINKYVPVALNSLYKLYTEEDDNVMDEENKGKMTEMKLKLKYQKKVDVIAEEDEDTDEELDEDAEEEETNEDNNENPQGTDAQVEDKGQIEEISEEKKNEAAEEQIDTTEKKENEDRSNDEIELIEDDDDIPDILDEVFQLKKRQSSIQEEEKKKQQDKHNESSFEIIDTTHVIESKMDEDKKKEEEDKKKEEEEEQEQQRLRQFNDDFEHLSQYDPDDEFLRSNKSIEIIDSILNKKQISYSSDFSIISSAKSDKVKSVISLSSNKSKHGIAFIQSNRDIYAEDVITQKIIYYISLFSEDVSSHLQQIRSKKILYSNKSEQEKATEEKPEDFLIDLDDIDQEFVNLILDVLEYYELFRLCLMVCNRYHMSERLGRYIISVCSKYSNLHNHRFNLQLLKNSHFNIIWKEKQRQASIIAHEAIHNVFTLIEPKFLYLKDPNEQLTKENSLGIETYRMMIDLGFWKKIVYIYNPIQSLQLCYKFYEKENFETLMNSVDFTDETMKTQVKTWYDQLVIRDYQMFVLKGIGMFQISTEEKKFSEVLKDLDQTYTEANQTVAEDTIINELKTVNYWMFLPLRNTHDVIKPGQKLNEDQLLKLLNKLVAQNNEEGEKVTNIYKEKLAQNGTFEKYFLCFLLSQTPNSNGYGNVLGKITSHFSVPMMEELITIYSQAIDCMNLERHTHHESTIMDALYSVFLISSLDENNTNDQSLFKNYNRSYMLVNTNSPIAKDIIALQQSFDAATMNEYMVNKLTELRPKYFQVKNFRTAFVKQFKDFINQFQQKHVFVFDKQESCFIVDMDAQFIMVPKLWLSLSISLANIIKQFMTASQRQLDEEGMSDNLTFEDKLNYKIKEFQVFAKVSQQANQSRVLHDTYVEKINNEQNNLMRQVQYNQDFQGLVNTYKNKTNFNLIKFTNIFNNATNNMINPIHLIENHFNNIRFDYGPFYKPKRIDSVNEFIQIGTNQFWQAIHILFDINKDNEEEVKSESLKAMLKAFINFMIIDEYEILLELIKRQIKISKKQNDNIQTDILKKYLLILDIHVFLKNGLWSSAVDSIFQFLNYFYNSLDNYQKVKLLENAFYLIMIGKFGNIIMPDYALNYLSIGFDLQQYYSGTLLPDNPIYEDDENGDQILVEEEERKVIDWTQKDGVVEKIDSETLYNEALYWINKILQQYNEDERSAYFKMQYIQLFNMLITVTINDPKKSSKTITQLTKGFELICNSSYDEYFSHLGLTDFNYSNAQGIQELVRLFKETEPEYQHQYFAHSQFGGWFIAQVDVQACQTSEAQIFLQNQIQKASIKEYKKVASHLYLSMKLKKFYQNKRSYFIEKKRCKSYSFEDRKFASDVGLYNLLAIDQLPGKQTVNLVKQLNLKQMMLRQMIVVKYAINSLDIHYILAKAVELQQLQDEYEQFVHKFISEKGQILNEFVDLDKNENEMERKNQELKKKYLEFDNDINIWMNQKAEPNLIEVERKSTKYKIKWESLKMFERKARLIAVMKKKVMIENKQ